MILVILFLFSVVSFGLVQVYGQVSVNPKGDNFICPSEDFNSTVFCNITGQELFWNVSLRSNNYVIHFDRHNDSSLQKNGIAADLVAFTSSNVQSRLKIRVNTSNLPISIGCSGDMLSYQYYTLNLKGNVKYFIAIARDSTLHTDRKTTSSYCQHLMPSSVLI